MRLARPDLSPTLRCSDCRTGSLFCLLPYINAPAHADRNLSPTLSPSLCWLNGRRHSRSALCRNLYYAPTHAERLLVDWPRSLLCFVPYFTHCSYLPQLWPDLSPTLCWLNCRRESLICFVRCHILRPCSGRSQCSLIGLNLCSASCRILYPLLLQTATMARFVTPLLMHIAMLAD